MNNYPKSENLKKAQSIMLEILNEVVAILERNNIKYWLEGGTALGAYRHGGFIPWDDDIDISIDKKDLKKAITLLDKNLSIDYVVQSRRSDAYYSLKHVKIRHKKSIFFEKGSELLKERGIFIDIFPSIRTNYTLQNKINGILKRLSNLNKLQYILSRIRLVLLRAANYLAKKNAFFVAGFEQYCYPIEIKEPLKKISFEKGEFTVVNDIEKYLEIHYGDFKILPPEEQRIAHSTNIIFLN